MASWKKTTIILPYAGWPRVQWLDVSLVTAHEDKGAGEDEEPGGDEQPTATHVLKIFQREVFYTAGKINFNFNDVKLK